MSMFINTNVAAINSHRNLAANNTQMGKTMEKLSSGYRINRAADDAAGLAISEKMRFQINGLNQAARNAQDGISLLQTAEGALTEVHSMLQRMNVIANQASNGTYQDADRAKLQSEMSQLASEINNIAKSTKFNGVSLLNTNSTDSRINFQVGVYSDNVIDIQLKDMQTSSLGLNGIKIDDTALTELKTEKIEELLADKGITFNTGTNVFESSATDAGAVTITVGGETINSIADLAKLKNPSEIKIDVAHSDGTSADVVNTSINFDPASVVTADVAKEFALRSLLEENGFTIADGRDGAITNGDGLTVSVQGSTDTISTIDQLVALTDPSKLIISRPSDGTNAPVSKVVEFNPEANSTLGGLDISSEASARNAVSVIESALNLVSEQRSAFGAIQNRLEHTINNLGVNAENLSAAEMRIRNADMAKEMTEFTRNQILVQAGTAMLAQANAMPQGVLKLLG